MPTVKPVTVIGLVDPLPVTPPHVAVKLVIAEPPFSDGAVKATDADPAPAVAVPIVGAAGGVA